MIKRVINFLIHNKEKGMTVKAYIYAAYYRLCILFFNKRHKSKLESMLGERNQESSYETKKEELRIAKKVSRHVNRVAEHTPWESKCMVRAMTAQRLLKEHNIETTLYLGVGTDENGGMRAHAWLRYGGYCVTGGGDTGCATVAKFKK